MKKIIAYAVYIIGITVFFLYIRFPGDAVIRYLDHQVRKSIPGLSLSIKELKPGFPAAATFSAVDVGLHRQPIAGADRLGLRLALPSVFASRKRILIDGDLYGGRMDATVHVSEMRPSPKLEMNGLLKNIQIGDIPALKQLEDYRVSGILDGTVTFANTEMPRGKGGAVLTVKDSAVEFTPALFGLERMHFEAIDLELELANQRVTVKRLNVESRDVSGSATGTIILQNPVARSTVNLQGEIKPHPTFIKQLGSLFPMEFMARNKTKTGGIPFRITGSLERPNFSLR